MTKTETKYGDKEESTDVTVAKNAVDVDVERKDVDMPAGVPRGSDEGAEDAPEPEKKS